MHIYLGHGNVSKLWFVTDQKSGSKSLVVITTLMISYNESSKIWKVWEGQMILDIGISVLEI